MGVKEEPLDFNVHDMCNKLVEFVLDLLYFFLETHSRSLGSFTRTAFFLSIRTMS